MSTKFPPTARLLRSRLVDVLVGPHGVDRYLELIRPEITVRDARAKVVDVRRQTARSVTLTLKPNVAWGGFRAGQFVRVGVEIDGVRQTRTYSPACSERSGLLELTVTTHPRAPRRRRSRPGHAGAGRTARAARARGVRTCGLRAPDASIMLCGTNDRE
jgi:stearoyl-CoA 9-desaturase NADPH oxidoreductase